jgi:hypothetical protein
MKKFWLSFITAFALAAFASTFVACGDDDNGGTSDTDTDTDTDTDADQSVDLSVSLMKGPPQPNTDVNLYVKNDVGEYVELIGNAKTEDYYGTASFTIAAADLGVTRIAAGPAEFWDEISELMLTGMRLESFVDTTALGEVSDAGVSAPTINFGVCGHLTARRIQNLMEGSSMAFADAKDQAEAELVTALNDAGILYNGTWTGCEAVHMVGSNSADSQFGAALHCAFDKLANMEASDTVEIGPKLQSFLDDYAADLSDDGLILAAKTDRLKTAVKAIEPMTECVNKLANYIAEQTGTSPTTPDANASTDMDQDGLPNSSDPDIDNDGFLNDEDDAPYDATVGGGMYMDAVNGLSWELTAPSASYAWADAQTYCNDLVFGGFDDWRMPTISELGTLVYGCDEASCVEDMGPADGCYWIESLQGDCFAYWASDECDTSNRSSLQFNIGYVACLIPADSYFVRCVRDTL